MQTFSILIFVWVTAGTAVVINGLTIPSVNYSGFTKIGAVKAKWFVASNYPADQDAALSECAKFVGGRLATILSREEFDVVTTTLPVSDGDYTSYWTAGRNLGGTWTWLTTNEPIDENLLFWDKYGLYPFGIPGHVLALMKYGNLPVSNYADPWGYRAHKRFVCEINSE